jgi:hypothetical protein
MLLLFKICPKPVCVDHKGPEAEPYPKPHQDMVPVPAQLQKMMPVRAASVQEQ